MTLTVCPTKPVNIRFSTFIHGVLQNVPQFARCLIGKNAYNYQNHQKNSFVIMLAGMQKFYTGFLVQEETLKLKGDNSKQKKEVDDCGQKKGI